MIRFRRSPLIIGVAVLLGTACRGKDAGDGGASGSVAGAAEAALMDRGLNLLYRQGDPIGAETWFRELLKMNSQHYGAHFQLAMALDRGGKPSEARPVWVEVLTAAGAVNDTATANTARTRLAAPDTVSQAALMSVGLNLLYAKNDPIAAAEKFRLVTARNPTHYGAHYQLAAAVDRIGRREEARPLWVKVLGMAVSYKDRATEETARSRLRQNP